MNKTYGSLIALAFLFGLGCFNVAKGVQLLKKKKVHKFWGILRIFIGLPIIAACIWFILYLKGTTPSA